MKICFGIIKLIKINKKSAGWVDGGKSRFKDDLQQSTNENQNAKNLTCA